MRAALLAAAVFAVLAPPAAAQTPSCAGRGKARGNGVLIVDRNASGTLSGRRKALYTVKPGGRGLRRLTAPGAGQEDGPLYGVAAAPNGRSATFIRYGTKAVTVELVSLRTRRARALPSGAARPLVFAPASWAPDGRTIAVAAGGGTWLTRPDGSGGHPLAAATFSQRAYSPNGRCLVGFISVANSSGRVAVVAAGGGAPTSVPGLPGPFDVIEAMRFTLDGRRIVFTARRGADRAAVWSVKPDGSGLRRVTALRSLGDAAVFSPDGRWLAYNDRRGTLVRRVSGGPPRRLLKRLWVKAWAPRPR
jgi:hypothetical protein